MKRTAEELRALRERWERRLSKFAGRTFAGLGYDEELSGPDGAWVGLYVPEGTPPERVERAKAEARYTLDVVSMSTISIPADWPGSDEFKPGEPVPWINAARWINEHHQCRRVNVETGELVPESKAGGVLLDGFTASMLCVVFDALNEKNRATFGTMSLPVAVKIGWGAYKAGTEGAKT